MANTLNQSWTYWVLSPGLGEVIYISRIGWFPVPSLWRAYLFVSAYKTLPSISVIPEYSVSFTFSLWKWSCKFIYQQVNCIGGSRNSLCGWIVKIHHSHQFSLPGFLVFAMRFSWSKSPADCEWNYWEKQPGRKPQWNPSNKHTNMQKITFIISAFIKTSFSGRVWGQGEQRETISGGWSLVQQCWDWKGRRFKRTMKPLAVKALREDTAFSYSAYSHSTR